MSRVHRASTAAALTYVQFGLSLVLGIALVPFVLDRIGLRLYGFWLASGEVLAYAAMADFGILAALPWMIAEADGRGDRTGIRRLMSTGVCAALAVSVLYVGLVAILWQLAPALLRLQPDERAAIAGPLALIACGAAIVLPLRVASSTLMALQDVKVHGGLGAASRVLEVTLTVTLLLKGYGLYALAVAATVPSLLVVLISVVRLRVLAPDLLRDWPVPSAREIARLFREGMGAWLGGWGWRLTVAADALILTMVGGPVWVTVMAMSAKLGHILTQMAWVPGDSGLVGMANLAGENNAARLRAAVTAVLRVYITLATAGACVVLAVNAPFVLGWLGPELFGGLPLNYLLAALVLVVTMVHGLAVVGSVLGHRVQVGVATLGAALVHVPLALLFAKAFGLIGVPLAAILTQTLVLLPALVWVLPERAGVRLGEVAREVWAPWARRSLPLLVTCGIAGPFLLGLPWLAAIALGAGLGAVSLRAGLPLLLDYPPVAALVRSRLAFLRLDGIIGFAPAQRPPLP